MKSVEIVLAETMYVPQWDFITDTRKRMTDVIEIHLTVMIIKFVGLFSAKSLNKDLVY